MAARGRTREQWARIVTAFEDSKQPLAKFCAQRRISPRTLTWWRWQLRAPRPAPAGDAIRLLPIEVIGEMPSASPAPARGVVLAVSGIEVRVEVGADIEYVAALVRSLRG